MTSRERVRAALNHEEPDLLPIDFGGMRSTGINAVAYRRLREHLGIQNGHIRLYDVFQQLAEPEPEVLNRLGGDVVQLNRLAPAFGIAIDRWKQGELTDGSPCLVPQGYDPVPDGNGNLFIQDNNGTAIACLPAGGLYFDQIHHPCAYVETFADIDRLPTERITDRELTWLAGEALRLSGTGRAVLGAFGGNILEAGQINWGYEKFFTAMALSPELVRHWVDRLVEGYLDDLKKYLETVGAYIDVIQFGDDLGTQQAPQISPRMYREIIKPYHARMYRYVREQYPHVKVFLHSCGAIYDLIPDLIDAGVEVLNPVQITAKGMDPQKLKTEFGTHLSFWGGGARMQTTVRNGSLAQIREETKELIAIFRRGGGYVFNQVHNIQSDISPERILAIYDTVLALR